MIIVIQGSLNENSRTAIVVQETVKHLKEQNIEHELIDLREHELPFCNSPKIETYDENTQALYKKLEKAKGYIIGMPVYQYSVSGVVKNFIDLMAGAMYYKPVGIICNSGGVRSYLASAELMKSLSFEVWSICVQPTIHTWSGDFEDGKIKNDKAIAKLPIMVENVLRYSKVEAAH
ncbi:MAG: NAD(P)H-dependent oxidoreductase [Candidatus Woesearchaeota archaeon]|nr:NAD(P)H-dependent oxidoreductase [Candidatus Woesearchaeota archaeon]